MTQQINSLEEYHAAYTRSVADPEGFWDEQARTFRWRKPYRRVLQWNFREPRVKWFLGGRLNITENCLDRHLETRGDQTPGVQPCLVDANGQEIEGNDVEGMLCIKFLWPAILRTTYGDHERCRQNYFANFRDQYFTGDGARRDADGLYRILGRKLRKANTEPSEISARC